MVDFIVDIIMINCVFIQTNKPTPRGQKFISTSKTIFVVGAEFKHPNFSIKKGIVHSNFPLSFSLVLLCCKNSYRSLVGENRGNISKEMAKKMKRRESLES
jgi:hypothetical protein